VGREPPNPFGSAFIRLIRFSFLCQTAANNLAVFGATAWPSEFDEENFPHTALPKFAIKAECNQLAVEF